MYSTTLFHNHTHQFRHQGTVKVWMKRARATLLIIDISSLNNQIRIPISSIQKTLLVNRGHENQPIQIILMLKSAVKIYKTNKDSKVGIR